MAIAMASPSALATMSPRRRTNSATVMIEVFDFNTGLHAFAFGDRRRAQVLISFSVRVMVRVLNAARFA